MDDIINELGYGDDNATRYHDNGHAYGDEGRDHAIILYSLYGTV